MKRIAAIVIALLAILTFLAAVLPPAAAVAESDEKSLRTEAHGLPLSARTLTRDELDDHAPWGDVVMFYHHFYAGGKMHPRGVGRTAIARIASMSGNAIVWKAAAHETETTMQITVSTDQVTLVYELNNSQAARELYAQLPLSIEVENYGGVEKIFYPPRKLGTVDTPLARNVRSGTLAYYAPWGDVVMFYDSFGTAAGLYELGRIVSGDADIDSLSGTILIEKTDGR